MSDFKIKGPRTYRQKWPGKYVMAIMFVRPEAVDGEMILELPVEREVFLKFQQLAVDALTDKEKKAKAD